MRVGGIEPPSRPWQGRVIPLNYARLCRDPTHYKVKSYIFKHFWWSQVEFARQQIRSRPRLAVLRVQNIATSRTSVQKSKAVCFFDLVRPGGISSYRGGTGFASHGDMLNLFDSSTQVNCFTCSGAPRNLGAPGRNRTPNPLVRSQVLYPLSYGRGR